MDNNNTSSTQANQNQSNNSPIVKHYTNGEITIVWQPAKCIHSTICWHTLPRVYHPREKPWIQPENATTGQLEAQIEKCPSGALSYYVNSDPTQTTNVQKKEQAAQSTTGAANIEVTVNGPLLVKGKLQLTIDGENNKVVDADGITALCRCGASSNKPYCDGTHKKINFQG